MSNSENYDDLAGRSKYLVDLAHIFRSRNATWAEFGEFLNQEFKGPFKADVIPTGLAQVTCRHNAGGVHHSFIQQGLADPALRAALFNSDCHSRPCVTLGTKDSGKGNAWVVADLLGRARNFLDGKGLSEGGVGFSKSVYFPSSQSRDSSSLPGSDDVQMVDEDLADLPLTKSAPERLRPRTEGDGPNDVVDVPADEEWSDSDAFMSSDAYGDREEVSASRGTGAKSTKLRVHALSKLWQVAGDSVALRRALHRLIDNPKLEVYHLCGCGLGSASMHSCVEPTHLVWGESSTGENSAHTAYHTVLRNADPNNYLTLLGVYRTANHGGVVW